MTDFDKVTTLLSELGIGYRPRISRRDSDSILVVLEANDSTKVEGYVGFFAYFVFDATTEAFEKVGIYE